MTSWLKAAEDLLEVVDRKAKLAAGEIGDEQPSSQASAPNGQGSQPKRSKPKKKPQKRVSSHETSDALDIERKQTYKEMPESDMDKDRDNAILLVENSQTRPDSFSDKATNKENQDVDTFDTSLDAPVFETISNNATSSVYNMEAEAGGSDVKNIPLRSNHNHTRENILEVHEGTLPQNASSVVNDNTLHNVGPVEPSHSTVLDDAESPENNEHGGHQSVSGDYLVKDDKRIEDSSTLAEKGSDLNKLPVQKSNTTSS